MFWPSEWIPTASQRRWFHRMNAVRGIPTVKKKRVSLDVFEESVLDMLTKRHGRKVEEIQKAIDDEYFIYELDDEGKEIQIKYSVVMTAKEQAAPEPVTKEMVAAVVAEAIQEIEKENPRNPLGNPEVKKKFTVPAECKRYGQLKAFTRDTIPGSEFKADERAFRFGMWARAAMGSLTAKEWCQQNGILLVEKRYTDDLLQKLHSEGTNTAGGYLIPDEFGADLIDLRERYGVARRLCKNVPMSSETRSDPRRTGGLTGYFVAEGGAGTESTGSWDRVGLTAKDLMVLTRMTNQVSADATLNLGDTLAEECGYAFSLKEDQCFLLGDATSTYGGITGVRQALTNVWTASVAGTATGITKASSTTIASLALTDFENAVGSLPQYADTPRTSWVCHRFFFQAVMVKLMLASGGVVSYEVSTGDRRPRTVFLGYPVEFSQVLPSTTAATTIFCLLGDFTLGASFGDRQMNTISFSEHASIGSQSVFERNEVAIRATERFDLVVHSVGDGTTPGPIVAVATG